MDLAVIATMNTAILKEMPLEEVLVLHPLIDGQTLDYRKAQKTRPIKARPISTILSEDSVMSKIVLATLEGHETLKASAFVCWGIDNDVWQQSEKNLHDKYTPTHVDADGWIHFEPKPDKPVDCCQILSSEHALGPNGGFSILNPMWGDKRMMEGKVVYVHYGIDKDYVLRGLLDPMDTYRVAEKFFNNTYEYLKG